MMTATTMGTGLKGRSVESLIEKFFGQLNRWPVEPDGHNHTQEQIKCICEHMSATGDCLWHAQTIVMGWPVCHCARCEVRS